MATKRKALPIDVKQQVLHESGYQCGNPVCRAILTLDIHHLVPVSDGGPNSVDNLLPLCPNCHSRHHAGIIPTASIRAWKMLLLSLNEAFDRRSIDALLALSLIGSLYVSGEGVLQCASLIASQLVESRTGYHADEYIIALTTKGKQLVEAWKAGDQEVAIGLTPVQGTRP